MHRLVRPIVLLALAFSLAPLTGCQNTYYKAWEKLGYEKRDILASRVKDARTDQEAAKEQFKTTLERFQEVTHFQGGDLEAQYNKLKTEYDRSESRASAVSSRIASIDKVANDMFKEWESEMSQIKTESLRQSDQQKLQDTKARYQTMISAMRRAESKMKPVLDVFNEQVIYLKHNLNASAIASLTKEVTDIETNVTGLIADMNSAINEANSFISQMSQKS